MAKPVSKVGEIPNALKHFDQLPDSANVRQPVVEVLFGCSGATVWRWVKSGHIPKPRKLSDRVAAWNVGELRQALSKEFRLALDVEVQEQTDSQLTKSGKPKAISSPKRSRRSGQEARHA